MALREDHLILTGAAEDAELARWFPEAIAEMKMQAPCSKSRTQLLLTVLKYKGFHFPLQSLSACQFLFCYLMLF